MRIKFNILAVLVVVTALSGITLAQGVPGHKETILKTYTVTGKCTGFASGDYFYADIESPKIKDVPIFINDGALQYFLAANVNKKGVFTLQKVKSYLESAGGYTDIDRVVSARFRRETYKQWWKAELKKHSQGELDKQFGPVVDKLTKHPGVP